MVVPSMSKVILTYHVVEKLVEKTRSKRDAFARKFTLFSNLMSQHLVIPRVLRIRLLNPSKLSRARSSPVKVLNYHISLYTPSSKDSLCSSSGGLSVIFYGIILKYVIFIIIE